MLNAWLLVSIYTSWAGYSDWLRAGRSGERIPVEARFSAPVQTGPGAQPASCTMGTGSFPGVKSGRGVTLTPYPLLVSWSRKRRAIPLLPLRAVRPIQCLYEGALYLFFISYVLMFLNPYSSYLLSSFQMWDMKLTLQQEIWCVVDHAS